MPTLEEKEPAAETEERKPAPTRWALSLSHLGVVALWVPFFLLLCYLPLRAPELWGHLIYGEWILEHRSLPVEDPVMPVAEGMEVVDTVWLSQVILTVVDRAGGVPWLSVFFALTVLTTYLILARAFFLASGSKLASTLGVLAAFALSWGRSTTLRPENFGSLCFAYLLLLLVKGSRSDDGGAAQRRLWYRVPLLFVLWANLHGSFVWGLLLLGCFFLGRVIEVGRETKSAGRVAADRTVRRWLYLGEIGAAATLLNPYGIDLWLYVLGVGGRANLAILPEVQPLVIHGLPGVSFALSWVALLILLRRSRRPLPAAHVLSLAAFGVAAAAGVGRLAWYGPVTALVLAPLVAELADRARKGRRRPAPSEPQAGRFTAGPSWHYTLLGAILVWLGFAFSPFSASLLGREPRTLGQFLGPDAPMAVSGFLAANPPRGPIFNPADWGDWLALEGPSGLQPFVTSRLQLIPPRVWQAYSRILWAGYEWETILERHTIETVVLDRLQHQRLVRALSLAEGWNMTYNDGAAMVFARAADDGDEAGGGASAGAAGAPPPSSTEGVEKR
jgi:hypothetical protein